MFRKRQTPFVMKKRCRSRFKGFCFKFQFLAYTFVFSYFALFHISIFLLQSSYERFVFFRKRQTPFVMKKRCRSWFKGFSLNSSFLLVTFYFLILLSLNISIFLLQSSYKRFVFFRKRQTPFVMKKRCRSWFKGFFFKFQFIFVFALYLFYFISFFFVTFWYFIFFVFTIIFVMHH